MKAGGLRLQVEAASGLLGRRKQTLAGIALETGLSSHALLPVLPRFRVKACGLFSMRKFLDCLLY